MKKVDIFLPPGVQQKLFARLRTSSIPRRATPAIAAKIEALWLVRNNAPEKDVAGIDAQMEAMAVASIKICPTNANLKTNSTTKNTKDKIMTMETAAKIMGLEIRPGEPEDLTIAQLIRQRADLLAALVDCRDCLIATRDSGRSDALTDWQKRAIGAGYEAMQSSGYPNAQDTSAKGGI